MLYRILRARIRRPAWRSSTPSFVLTTRRVVIVGEQGAHHFTAAREHDPYLALDLSVLQLASPGSGGRPICSR